MNQYCWITGTHRLGDHELHNISSQNASENEKIVHSYYQWIPYFLILLVNVFYGPTYSYSDPRIFVPLFCSYCGSLVINKYLCTIKSSCLFSFSRDFFSICPNYVGIAWKRAK